MRRSRRALTRRNPGLKPSNDSETDMTGARSQEKGLFSGMKKPLMQPLRIRIRSREAPAERARSAYDGCELSKYRVKGQNVCPESRIFTD